MGKHVRVIADALSKEVGISQREGRRFLQRFIEVVAKEIAYTGRIELRGLGTFTVKERKAHYTQHPAEDKDDTVFVPAKKFVAYRSSETLRQLLNRRDAEAD